MVMRRSVGTGTSSMRWKWNGSRNDMTSSPTGALNTVPAPANVGAPARLNASDRA